MRTYEGQISALKAWFDGSQETKGPFWKLHSGARLIQNQLKDADPESSFDTLESSINLQWMNGLNAFKVSLMRNENDGKPIIFTVKLPRYEENKSSVGAMGGNFDARYHDLQAKLYEEKLENYKTTSRLEQQLAVMEARQQTMLSEFKDLIYGVFNSPTVQGIGKVITTKLTNQYLGGEVPSKINTLENAREIDSEKVDQAIEKLGKHYENPDEVMLKLSKYLEQNPAAKGFIDNILK